MKLFSTVLVLAATIVSALPTQSSLESLLSGGGLVPRSFRNKCDLTRAKLPESGSPDFFQSNPAALKAVLLGRGTQNYTCETSDDASAPALKGAYAVLLDVTCLAVWTPTFLDSLPDGLLTFSMRSVESQSGINMSAGKHYFLLPKTPIFDVRGKGAGWDRSPQIQNVHEYGPDGSIPDPRKKNVDWLRLNNKKTRDINWDKVYRVTTAGGRAPKTCKGMPSEFIVDYAANYYFYD